MLTAMERYRGFLGLLVSALLVGFLAVLFVLIWVLHFREGLGWDGGALEFNWHPVLAVTGFVFIQGIGTGALGGGGGGARGREVPDTSEDSEESMELGKVTPAGRACAVPAHGGDPAPEPASGLPGSEEGRQLESPRSIPGWRRPSLPVLFS